MNSNEDMLNELLGAVRNYGTTCGTRNPDREYDLASVDAFGVVRQITRRIIEHGLLSAVRDYGRVCATLSGDPNNAEYQVACVEAFAAVRQIAERIIEPTQLDYLALVKEQGDA